jgi:pimeloyl-ACP methyl ester carboxylesterase
VRAAAFLFGPIAGATARVPMDHFLRAGAWPLTRPYPVPGLAFAQRFTSLVNPELGPPAELRAILAAADPESPDVARALAAMAVHRRPELCGVNLEQALHAATVPVCVVVGTKDVFAPEESVAAIRRVGQAGPRRLIVIPDGSHVDVPVGHHAYRLGQDVWRFLAASSR